MPMDTEDHLSSDVRLFFKYIFPTLFNFLNFLKPEIVFFVQAMVTGSKVIPRLVDNNSASLGELNPNDWDVNDVAHFLKVNDCAAYCENFAKKVEYFDDSCTCLVENLG